MVQHAAVVERCGRLESQCQGLVQVCAVHRSHGPVAVAEQATGPGRAGEPPTFAEDTECSEQLAIDAVMDAERRLGCQPRVVHTENLGYDIDSVVPSMGRL